MKKAIVCLLGIVLLTSCTQTVVTDSQYWKVVNIDVPENSWGWSSNGGYYMATVDVPELTRYICTDGFVQCYEVSGDYQWVLPYTRYYEEVQEDNTVIRWEVTMDYEFAPGRVDFYCSANDFAESFPGAKRFRMVLHW